MSDIETPATGHYYEKQIACKSSVIAWSHRSRFTKAAKLIGDGRIERVLDYGCGDGTFLASIADRVSAAVGADVADGQLRDCAERLKSIPKLSFLHVNQLNGPEHDARYDVVTCMETLEHCPAPIVEAVLGDLGRLCKPSGRIVISVPIEIGPTFPMKYSIRKLAGWRGLSDYKHYERYTIRNAFRMMFATRETVFDRPIYGTSHSHYGFNWRALRERVKAHLTLERTRFSPLAWLGGLVSSQAWFICRPKKVIS